MQVVRISLAALLLATWATASNAATIGTVWNSWDTVILTDAQANASGNFLNRGQIIGSDSTPAYLQMYITNQTFENAGFDVRVARSSASTTFFVDDDGNAPSPATTGIYRTNPDGHEGLIGGYGHASAGPGPNEFDDSSWWAVPQDKAGGATNRGYMGKAGPRPDDGTHGTLPGGVAGDPVREPISDLAFHGNNSGRLNVFAFVAPVAGVYEITELAMRRVIGVGPVSNRDRSTALQVFDNDGNPVGDFFYTGHPHPDERPVGHDTGFDERQWVYSPDTFQIQLDAGERIFLGAHHSMFTTANNHWDFDNTELAFTIELVPEPAAYLQAVLGAIGLIGLGWIRRRRRV